MKLQTGSQNVFIYSIRLSFDNLCHNSSRKRRLQPLGRYRLHTLNREATEENLYDDLDDSSGSEGKRPATKEHFEEDKRLQCSTTT